MPDDTVHIAHRHGLTWDGPNPDFFEGMLLGNGDLGVCVTVRPDAIVLHLGKTDTWDIRHSEEFIKDLVPFSEFVAMVRRISERVKRARSGKEEPAQEDRPFHEKRHVSEQFNQQQPDAIDWINGVEHDPEYQAYANRMNAGYRKPWPRPWPCSQVFLHFDPRRVSVETQQLDIISGLLRIRLLVDGVAQVVSCMVHRDHNLIWLWETDAFGQPAALPVTDVTLRPHRDPATGMPEPSCWQEAGDEELRFGFVQRLPIMPPTTDPPEVAPVVDGDQSFSMAGVMNGPATATVRTETLTLTAPTMQVTHLCLSIFNSREAPDPAGTSRRESAAAWTAGPATALDESTASWARFWAASAIELDDADLEATWYRNQYWLACCLKPGEVAPGLFGNWMAGNIGTAWHGDYHLNYNTQQAFWGVFSSNHVEQHEPYVDLCWNLFRMACAYARDHFGLPGAYYPHSAYPIPSAVNPYPCPPWGYEMCEIAWAMQSLWWHYLYTQDETFLAERAYPILREGARFYAAYLTREDNGRYHVFPTVSPEMYGITVDFRYNKDCITDLALIRFLLDAVVTASTILGCDADERARWADIRVHLAEYPTGETADGPVWLDVAGGPVNPVYNVPASLTPIFPGEQVGLDSPPDVLDVARRSVRLVRLEGGNDLVFQPLIRARLGQLDLEWFKREIRYCRTPNGTCTDRVRQVGGRYSDRTPFDFMSRMGVWVENFGLPAVINECLLQSYNGRLRLFPNTTGLRRAAFRRLRAVGAFLVSGSFADGTIGPVLIESLAGQRCRLVSPWPDRTITIRDASSGQVVPWEQQDDAVEFATETGRGYEVKPA